MMTYFVTIDGYDIYVMHKCSTSVEKNTYVLFCNIFLIFELNCFPFFFNVVTLYIFVNILVSSHYSYSIKVKKCNCGLNCGLNFRKKINLWLKELNVNQFSEILKIVQRYIR